jgi:hypothetical protein
VPDAGRALRPNQSLRAVANAVNGGGSLAAPSIECISQSCAANPPGLSSFWVAVPGENVAIAARFFSSAVGDLADAPGCCRLIASCDVHDARKRNTKATQRPT